MDFLGVGRPNSRRTTTNVMLLACPVPAGSPLLAATRRSASLQIAMDLEVGANLSGIGDKGHWWTIFGSGVVRAESAYRIRSIARSTYLRCSANAFNRVCFLIGFARCALHPASKLLSTSSFTACAVSAMIGVCTRPASSSCWRMMRVAV